MKEVYTIKEVKEVSYEAIDGTQFKDKAECKKYEDSALCVLLSKYKPLIVKRTSPECLFNSGSDEDDLDIIKLSNKSDIDNVLQLYSYYAGSYAEERIPKYKEILDKAFSENDLVLIYRGYCGNDDSFYIQGSLNSMLENIKKLCNETN